MLRCILCALVTVIAIPISPYRIICLVLRLLPRPLVLVSSAASRVSITGGQVLVFSTVVQAMVPTNHKPVPSIDTRVITVCIAHRVPAFSKLARSLVPAALIFAGAD